jgi:NAD(P)-dependent dehydrogenase (short-subunit alcohol dehydrogenase family)
MNVMDKFSLKGKTALVTGGAGQYGGCIAEGLAEAGAKVIIASRNLENCRERADSLRAAGLDAFAGEVDIADEESVFELRKSLAAEFGGTDILVNNAVSRPGDDMRPVEAWTESMRVNAVGLYIVTSVFLEEMAGRKNGNIINISSMYGMVSQYPPLYEGTNLKPSSLGDYWFHKGGMINYTRFIAGTYAPFNIRANCVSPGGFHGKGGQHSEKFLENYAEKVPLGRMAEEDDIKGAVVFLASDASCYVTGHNLVVDGGWTIW